MKISVITICHNDPDIEVTCESIINQSFQDFEWIVIDGGSNQETINKLSKYKNRINQFISEKDSGVFNAMNKGIKLAHGEYLNFLNTGDFYYSEHSLQSIYEHLNGEDIIFGDQKFLTRDDFFIKHYPETIPYGWFKYECIPHQSSFIKRDLFDKYGLYNENNRIVSDWEKWIELVEINKCNYKHVPILISTHNYTGISSIMNYAHKQERKKVIKKYYGSLDKFDLIKKFLKNIGILKQA